MLAAAFQGDTVLLQDMKLIRKGGGGPADLPDTVAGTNGEQEIAEAFRFVYSGLYNSASTEDEMRVLHERIGNLITPESVQHVAKVTGSIVKEAVCSMKPRKSDVTSCYTTDALLNAPDIV